MAPRPTPKQAKLYLDMAAMLRVLSTRHVMPILWAIYSHESPVSFTELRTLTNVNPATLSVRLRQLEQEGLVSRTPLHVIPRRVEYSVTPLTRGMAPVFRELLTWRARFPRPAPGKRAERSRRETPATPP